jgi:hypothetical protein
VVRFEVIAAFTSPNESVAAFTSPSLPRQMAA